MKFMLSNKRIMRILAIILVLQLLLLTGACTVQEEETVDISEIDESQILDVSGTNTHKINPTLIILYAADVLIIAFGVFVFVRKRRKAKAQVQKEYVENMPTEEEN